LWGQCSKLHDRSETCCHLTTLARSRLWSSARTNVLIGAALSTLAVPLLILAGLVALESPVRGRAPAKAS